MKKYLLYFVIIAFTACNANNEKKEQKAIKAAIPKESDTLLSKTDDAVNLDKEAASFLQQAGADGMFEVESSSRILTTTKNDLIKKFAALLVKDHKAIHTDLTALAKNRGYALPNQLAPTAVAEINRMDDFKDEGKNEYYVQLMINQHRKNIDNFALGSRSNDNEINNYATQMLPKLKQHYQQLLKIDTLIKAPKANQGDDPLKISNRAGQKG